MKRIHYSGKVTKNSQVHLGVFLDGRLEGVMQFGPSLDKRRMLGLVRDTGWNGFIELNRLAFSENLPRNSESRALSIAFRMFRKSYPHIEWIVSFADGTQCGDGTIYRASGFVLTSIKKNSTIWGAPSGEVFTDLGVRTGKLQAAKADKVIFKVSVTKAAAIVNRTSATDSRRPSSTEALASIGAAPDGSSSMKRFKAAGFAPLAGFQLRYIYFLNPAARARLTVPEVPFEKIAELGAAMYRGKTRGKQAMAGVPPAQRRGSGDRHAPDPTTRRARGKGPGPAGAAKA